MSQTLQALNTQYSLNPVIISKDISMEALGREFLLIESVSNHTGPKCLINEPSNELNALSLVISTKFKSVHD